MTLAVCSLRWQLGVLRRQNEALGKNGKGMEEGRKGRLNCNLPLMKGQGHRTHRLLRHSDEYHPPDSPILTHITVRVSSMT